MLKKRNLIFLSLLILGVFLITSCLPKPPVTEGILKGQVIVPEGSAQAKDLTGQALANATVNIIDPVTGDIIATTITDANGYYQVFVPAGGPYLLQAIKDGVVILQITPQVEVGIEYDLGTADCSTTAVALIVQAMLVAEDYPNNIADINLADIEADPDFNDVMSIVCSKIEAGEVMSIVCSTIEAGGDPTALAVVQQAVEDFLHPPAPSPAPAPSPIDIAAIPGVTAPVTGATPVTTITETAQYTGTVTWSPNDSTFAGTTVYTATIALTAKPGFTLTGVTENFFTVSEATTDTNPADSGVVTAVFPATAEVTVGDSYGGGIVAYIFVDGDPDYVPGETHGLIAATADQSTGIIWAIEAYQNTEVGGTLLTIGSGSANTDKIIIQNGAGSTYAAGLARAYTGGGYTDWFLPSKDELNKLRINRVAIGGFAGFYWSSSEYNVKYAWYQAFGNGNQYNYLKGNAYRVRAVRAF
jgi:hypothetical protein